MRRVILFWALLFGRIVDVHSHPTTHCIFFYFKIFILIFLTNQAVHSMGVLDGARTKIITLLFYFILFIV